MMQEKYGYHHLSAGDLLREERQRGSKNAIKIETCIREGEIVPMEITIELLRNAMQQSESKNFLIDGFPRKMDQALCFEETVCSCEAVIYFNCSEETLKERIMRRSETSQRTDDNVDSMLKRFRTYKEQTMPVIEMYRKSGKLIEIESDKAPMEVFEEVVAALEL